MAKVHWVPIKPGDARDVAKVNTALTTMNTQSTNVTSENIREEGLDYTVMHPEVATQSDAKWSRFFHWDPQVGTTSDTVEVGTK